MKLKLLALTVVVGASTLFSGCTKDGKINIFSIEDEKTLGLQTKQQIESDPGQFPIIAQSANPAAYSYLYAIRDEILASGQLTYANDFVWELKIIDDDNTMNAFCTPGGYIYVYTGLIKYLDSKSALAGVLGHEMAHADRRHSTNQLTKQYGVQTLLDVVLGKNQGLVTEIAAQLVALRFSRSDESDADAHSVMYLCPTKYYADGAAEFFEKIEQSGGSNVPEFLSTHPSPDNRVHNIQEKAVDLACGATITNSENDAEYAQFKASL